MTTLIVGRGQIGKALRDVLIDYYAVDTIDKGEISDMDPEIMHICFPYSEEFIEEVKKYQHAYRPDYTVIHSTVPPGTSRKLGAIHSPVKGIHPNLEEGIRTFTKFIGGDREGNVGEYFHRAGLKVHLTNKPESTELIKVDSTNWHGTCIEKTKDTKRLCEKYDVPFELFLVWTKDYNKGYEKLGHPEFKRPHMTPMMKKIGGHCVLDNLKFVKSKFSDLIRKLQSWTPTSES